MKTKTKLRTFNTHNLPLGFYKKSSYYGAYLIEGHVRNTITAKSNEYKEKEKIAESFPIYIDVVRFESAVETSLNKWSVSYSVYTHNQLKRQAMALCQKYMTNDLKFDRICFDNCRGVIVVEGARFDDM